MRFFQKLIAMVCLTLAAITLNAQQNKFDVLAYFAGKPEQVDSCEAEKLTHIIFSFCHLKGNRLAVDNSIDSITIKKLVSLKARNNKLKIILSLGGWGGCESCSDVFSSEEGRNQFALSVLELNRYFNTDGIDLDWEYPAVEGYPGHKFMNDDKKNFTLLVQALRKSLGQQYEISFAAGGFQKCLEESIDWPLVMKEVDRVNIMSYDLVNGYSKLTGHHTPLYSTPKQIESADNAVQYLIRQGIPSSKLVIGGAFYSRIWKDVPDVNNGLNQSGVFKTSIDYKDFKLLSPEKGFKYLWDDVAKAPYMYNAAQKLFVTYDDVKSTMLKTQYVVDQKLGGIMFWEITADFPKGDLLSAIDSTKKNYKAKSTQK
jgi:chitinase